MKKCALVAKHATVLFYYQFSTDLLEWKYLSWSCDTIWFNHGKFWLPCRDWVLGENDSGASVAVFGGTILIPPWYKFEEKRKKWLKDQKIQSLQKIKLKDPSHQMFE